MDIAPKEPVNLESARPQQCSDAETDSFDNQSECSSSSNNQEGDEFAPVVCNEVLFGNPTVSDCEPAYQSVESMSEPPDPEHEFVARGHTSMFPDFYDAVELPKNFQGGK